MRYALVVVSAAVLVGLALALTLERRKEKLLPRRTHPTSAGHLRHEPPPQLAGAQQSARSPQRSREQLGGSEDQLIGRVELSGSGSLPASTPSGILYLVPADQVDLNRLRDESLLAESTVYGAEEELGLQTLASSLRGTSVNVVSGRWRMTIPDEDLLVLGFSTTGHSYRVVGGARIATGAIESVVLVAERRGVTVHVRDSYTGQNLNAVDIFSAPRPPSNVPVFLAAHSVGTARRPLTERDHWVDAPPGGAKQLAAGETAPVRIQSTLSNRQLWIGADGYAWAVAELPVRASSVDVELSRVGGLSVEVDAADWPIGSLHGNIMRNGRSVERFRVSASTQTFDLDGVGAGEYRIFLEYKERVSSGLLCEKVATVTAGMRSRVELRTAGRDQVLNGKLEVHLAPSNSPGVVSRSFDVRLSRRKDAGFGQRKAGRIGSASMVREKDHFVLRSGPIEPGDYLITVGPGSVAYPARVGPGERTLIDVDLPPPADISVHLEGSLKNTASGHAIRLLWQLKSLPEDAEFSAQYSGGSRLLRMPSAGEVESVSVKAWAGTYDFVALDADSNSIIASSFGAEILTGPNDVLLIEDSTGYCPLEISIELPVIQGTYTAFGGHVPTVELPDSTIVRPYQVSTTVSDASFRTGVARFLVPCTSISDNVLPEFKLGGSSLEVLSSERVESTGGLSVRLQRND